jgi:hypothetical protein
MSAEKENVVRPVVEDWMPECEKLVKVAKDSQKIGDFLEWLFGEKNYTLGKWHGDYLRPVHERIEELLAEYFGIDLSKVETERREMLKALREQRRKR